MNTKKNNLLWINILCIMVFTVVTVPLLILGHYDYPSADDWSLASITRQVLQAGGGLGDILKSIGETIMVWREKGEPRYSSVFFASLQPGIWGEHFYRITPWLMIGSLCFAEILLCTYLLKDNANENRKWIIPIIIPSLVLQLLCVPYPVETFYWYTGSVNYTFVFGLSLILLTLFLMLIQNTLSPRKTFIIMAGGIILAAIIGGNNYATSLSSACIFVALSCLLLFRNRKAFYRTLPITTITCIGLIICLIAPGNQVRLNEEFGGSTTGAFNAIVMSLARTGMNIFSWTSIKIVLMLAIISPFLWMAIKQVDFHFRNPVIFTIFTYGIYASQIVATMYVDGTTGGRRMADILYYAYHVWLLSNAGYWLGWVQKQQKLSNMKFVCKIKDWVENHLGYWFTGMGILLVIVIALTELQQLSTYRAYAWLIKGYAKEYAIAWEDRLAVLNDKSIKVVYFDPLPGYEELVFYTDFQLGENWVNNACEIYYGKEYIGLK